MNGGWITDRVQVICFQVERERNMVNAVLEVTVEFLYGYTGPPKLECHTCQCAGVVGLASFARAVVLCPARFHFLHFRVQFDPFTRVLVLLIEEPAAEIIA